MKPAIPALTIALLATALGCFAILQGRAVSVAGGGYSLEVGPPIPLVAAPEIQGEHEQLGQDILVHGRALIVGTMPNGTIREIVVPAGQSRLVRLDQTTEGTQMQVFRQRDGR